VKYQKKFRHKKISAPAVRQYFIVVEDSHHAEQKLVLKILQANTGIGMM